MGNFIRRVKEKQNHNNNRKKTVQPATKYMIIRLKLFTQYIYIYSAFALKWTFDSFDTSVSYLLLFFFLNFLCFSFDFRLFWFFFLFLAVYSLEHKINTNETKKLLFVFFFFNNDQNQIVNWRFNTNITRTTINRNQTNQTEKNTLFDSIFHMNIWI